MLIANVQSHYKAALRQVGHELLLSDGDSTSRVLPIEHDSGTYLVSFESTFAFDPGELAFIVYQSIDRSQLVQHYLVEVRSCDQQQVVHSYMFEPTSTDSIIPCKGRKLPEDCYQLFFKPLQLTPALTNYIDTATTSPIPIQSSSTDSDGFNWKYGLFIGASVLMLISLVLWRFKKRKNQSINDAATTLAFGQSQLDPIRMKLTIHNNPVELTSKEADLLALLAKHINEPLTRETLLNQIWGDEGDYIGRTLDVYISKLRKKLEPDNSIKLLNIRGVGYKLVID